MRTRYSILSACLYFVGLLSVLATIPTAGGAEEAGLVAKLSFVREIDTEPSWAGNIAAFRPGEPILLKVAIRNESKEQVVIDDRLLGLPSTFVVRDSSGEPLSSITRISYPVFPVVPRSFSPGEEYSFRVDLLDMYPDEPSPAIGVRSLFAPDHYTVQLILRTPIQEFEASSEECQPATLWGEDLESDPLDFTVRPLAEEEIAHYLAGLSSLPPKERMQTFALLGGAGAKAAVSQIASVGLSDPSADVRLSAIQALWRAGDRTAISAVERALLEDPSPIVSGYAAALLGHWREPRSVPVLIRALRERHQLKGQQGQSRTWYGAAIRALGDIADPRGLEVLAEISQQDSAPLMRALAAFHINRIRHGDAPEEQIREYAERCQRLGAAEAENRFRRKILLEAYNTVPAIVRMYGTDASSELPEPIVHILAEMGSPQAFDLLLREYLARPKEETALALGSSLAPEKVKALFQGAIENTGTQQELLKTIYGDMWANVKGLGLKKTHEHLLNHLDEIKVECRRRSMGVSE